ncbi:MAG: YadA-like family protein [Fusobacterium sp.]
MNKKFLVGALLVALSTAGYAFDYTHQDVQSGTSGFVGAEKGQTSFNEIKDELNRLDSTKLDKDTFYDAYNEFHLGQTFTDETLKTHREQIEDLQKENEEQAGKLNEHAGRLDGLEGQMSETLGAIQDIDRTNNLQNEKLDSIEKDLDKKVDQKEFDKYAGKVDGMAVEFDNINNTIDQNKAEQAEIDKKQDAAIDSKIDKDTFYDAYNELHMGQTFTDETLKTHREQIEDLDKNKVDKNTYEEDKKAQAETDKKQDQALKDETAAREEADKNLQGQINDFNNKFAGYDGRLSGLEKKVDHLDDKMNKGLSLMAAMNAVDFQNVQTGEMALGAGVGHYGNAQSVALGVAYSPVEDLTVNAKYSVTAGDADSFAVGAGATYKFKVGR